jgi:peptidyl-prolyl isomerase G (cyclophilin G)
VTNKSRFFVTLEPCPHLYGRHTIFGRLVAGQDVLDNIAKVEVDKDDRPLVPVLIARCGELEKRKKAAAPPPGPKVSENSTERGRRRKSDPSDEEMRDSPEPAKARKLRRQSDNVVDEGLRGRPRQRTRSRSASQPLSTPSEERSDLEQDSPVEKHKRKRSPSPSRHVDRQEDLNDYERRRRRSLPNQYRSEDDERYRPSPRRGDYRLPDRRRGDGYRSRRDDNRGDRYRPRDHYGDEGRLGSSSGYDDEFDPPVKFKGRGIMKYREPGRL